jgi:hypothetical protein
MWDNNLRLWVGTLFLPKKSLSGWDEFEKSSNLRPSKMPTTCYYCGEKLEEGWWQEVKGVPFCCYCHEEYAEDFISGEVEISQ